MIELEGKYQLSGSGSESTLVLVQYDGVILHVWHLAEPFHRLVFSDVFQISSSFSKKRHTIKLPNGGKIDILDQTAMALLCQEHKKRRDASTFSMLRNWAIAILGFMSLMIGLWSLAHRGIL
ncbi:MAG: hypothetical protein VR64_16385 [Desulfatitalea sp. BRH_c12]|nr:MAG: hypothetical protein VR64_16385 [Desulfatitalea sp. BRH_c12]